MTSKKYEFHLSETKIIKGRSLKRIRALVDIPLQRVKAGDFGGYIESEDNLSHENNAWVAGNSAVYGSSLVSRNALVAGEAIVFNSNIYGDITVEGKSELRYCTIKGSGLHISGNALVEYVDIDVENGFIQGLTTLKNIFGRNKLSMFTMQGNASVVGDVDNHMLIGGDNISFSGKAKVLHAAGILGSDISLKDNVLVENGVTIHGKGIHLSDYARIDGKVTLRENLSVSELAHVFSSKGSSQVGNMEISGDASVDCYLL